MKFDGEITELLATYDLTRSLRATTELIGCWHRTVARYVATDDAGWPLGEPDQGSDPAEGGGTGRDPQEQDLRGMATAS